MIIYVLDKSLQLLTPNSDNRKLEHLYFLAHWQPWKMVPKVVVGTYPILTIFILLVFSCFSFSTASSFKYSGSCPFPYSNFRHQKSMGSRILMEFAFSLWIALDNMDIITIISLSFHEHGMSFHLLTLFSVFWQHFLVFRV